MTVLSIILWDRVHVLSHGPCRLQLILKRAQDRQKPFILHLCGQALMPGPERDKDHVPPSGLFALADCDQPLILSTHRLCNGGRSQEDQAIGQLVGVLHGRRVNRNHNKLQIKVGRFTDGSRGAALEGFDIREPIRPWVRGFHAALYGEYLPPDCSFTTYTPLPEAIRQGDEVVLLLFQKCCQNS